MLHVRKVNLFAERKRVLSIIEYENVIALYTGNQVQRKNIKPSTSGMTIEYTFIFALGHADALSRLMNNHKLENDDTAICSKSFEEDVSSMQPNVVRTVQVTTARMANNTHRDLILETKSEIHKAWLTLMCNIQSNKTE